MFQVAFTVHTMSCSKAVHTVLGLSENSLSLQFSLSEAFPAMNSVLERRVGRGEIQHELKHLFLPGESFTCNILILGHHFTGTQSLRSQRDVSFPPHSCLLLMAKSALLMVTAKLEEEPRAEGQELAKLSHLLSSHLVCSCEMAAPAMSLVCKACECGTEMECACCVFTYMCIIQLI